MDIQQLIQRVQQGETAYFAQIVQRFEPKMLITVYRIVRNRTVAEDLVQDIFIKVFYRIHDYKPTSSFNAWLYRIAVNYCFDYLRKQRIDHITLTDHATDFQQPENMLLMHERNEQLEQLLQQLDQTDYIVLVLKYVNNLSYEEICEVMHLTANEVRNKLHRSKKKLRQLNDKGGYFHEMQ